MDDRIFHIGALLGGAAIIATAMAVNPATARDLHTMLKPNKTKSCSSSNPCAAWNNAGGGNGAYAQAANDDGFQGTTTNPSSTQRARSGVYGYDGSSDGGTQNAGVGGYSPNGYGVSGSSSSGYGVFGTSTSGLGVEGVSSTKTGVLGAGAYGVFGMSSGGTGVFGSSATGFAIEAHSDNAASLVAQPYGSPEVQTIEAIGGTSGDSYGFNLATFQSNGTDAFWVDNNSNAHVNGLIYTNGSCGGGCDRKHGAVVSYAAQVTSPMLDDVGSGTLVSGEARVRFDASLADAIDPHATYVVFVSPEGPNHGLYVTQKSPTGFTVMENPGGRSTIPFSYRIVARPYGVHASRLPYITAAQMPKMSGRRIRKPTIPSLRAIGPSRR